MTHFWSCALSNHYPRTIFSSLIPTIENQGALVTQIFLGPWWLVTFDFSIQVLFGLEVEAFLDQFLRGQVLLMCPIPQKLKMVEGLSLVDSMTK